MDLLDAFIARSALSESGVSNDLFARGVGHDVLTSTGEQSAGDFRWLGH